MISFMFLENLTNKMYCTLLFRYNGDGLLICHHLQYRELVVLNFFLGFVFDISN